MNDALLDTLRASVLLEALRKIEEIAADNEIGAAMRIQHIARAAIQMVDPK